MPVSALRRRLLAAVFVAGVGLCFTNSVAQELVPRAFWPAPHGTDLLVVGYQHTTGDVVTDPTLPAEGVEASANYFQVTYQRTASLFGRTTNIQANLPYLRGTADGFIEGEYQERSLSGFSDARFTLAINLKGAPTMDAEDMKELRANPRTIIGASILVQPPTGSYDPDRVINPGSNRWSTKLSLGSIVPISPQWLFESRLGVWLFSDNDEYLGTTREQDPIGSVELNLIRRFSPGFWASLDLTYYAGGRTTVDDDIRADLQQNSRVGITLLYPIKPRMAIRFALSTTIVADAGGDYDSFSVNYAYAW